MQQPTSLPTTSTPSRQAIARDGAVLPLILGRGRAGVQWVTPVLHWTYRNTSRSSYAFFSCFGEVCLGPVDEIVQIWVNGKPYHGIYADRADSAGAHYVESVLAKETPETFRVYWGLETQTGLTAYVQSLIQASGHSEASKTHPNYLGRVVIGVKDMEAGQTFSGQTPQLPNVEVEVYRRSPTAYSFGGIAWGTHPVGIVKDILTDPRGGLGLPSSLFDSTHWTNAMQRMMDDGASGKVGTDLFISPVIGESREAGQVLSDVFSYFDGFIRQRNGKIEIDWQPNDGTTTSATGLRELSHHDMTSEPQLDAQGIEDMVTQISVAGLDYASDVPLTEASEVAQVPYAREIIGEPRTLKIDRPWFVHRPQLRGYAQTQAAARSSPAISGQITVRRESATQPDNITPLRPGDRFNLDYEPRSLDIVCRIIQRDESDDKADVTLRFQSERGASPEPYIAPLDPRAEIAPPAPPTPTRFVIAQVPTDITIDASNYATALVERTATNAAGFEVQFAATDSWPGQTIDAANTRFAVGAVLVGSLSSGSSDATITVDGVGNEFGRFESQSALEQSDDTLLAYRGGEWFSVGTITSLGGGEYTLAVKRARLGSLPTSHADNSVFFLILRSDLIQMYHASFDEIDIAGIYDVTTATKWFKIRAYNSVAYSALTAATSLVMLDPTPAAPTSLVATAGTGKMIGLAWDPVENSLVNEYQIYRATGPGYGDEALLAETSEPYFWDVEVVIGTTYRYRVRAMTTEDTPSPYTSYATATAASAGGLDTTAPSNPSAATLNTSSAYVSGDGTVFSRLVINVPSMPSGAVVLNVLYRRNGSTGWIIGDQRSSGGSTSAIDDLTPGTSYEVACQAFSAYGYASAIVAATSSPFTAPNTSSGPAAPAWGMFTTDAPAVKAAAGTSYQLGIRASWAPVTDASLAFYEIKSTTTDSDGATDYNWATSRAVFPNSPTTDRLLETSRSFYSESPAPNGYVRVRSVNRSGVASSWLRIGNALSVAVTGAGNLALQAPSAVSISGGSITNITDITVADGGTGSSTASGARTNLGLGSIATQNSSDVITTGIKLGGSGAVQIIATHPESTVKTLTGGSPTESHAVSLSGRGFTAKPTFGAAEVASLDPATGVFYDYDHASNSSSNAYITFFRYDGGNLTAGARRVSVLFIQT